MPSYAQLQSEAWWIREYQPPALADLCRRLREHYRVSAVALGSKGDNNHLNGYHRSAAWVLNSAYSTNRTYSVTETPGNRKPGDPNWLCAVDATLPSADLIAACQRLDAAVRAGRLEKVTEWYGNDDGDNRVDGYNNVANVVASSDDSHLWHLHMSFDRGRANENHDDVFAILTGTEQQGDDDMPKMFRVTNGAKAGLIGISNGPTWYHIPAGPPSDMGLFVRAATGLWGIADKDIVAVNEEWLPGFGVEVPWPGSGGSPGGPVSGTVDLSAKALADVRKVVDEENDEQSAAGADKDL